MACQHTYGLTPCELNHLFPTSLNTFKKQLSEYNVYLLCYLFRFYQRTEFDIALPADRDKREICRRY